MAEYIERAKVTDALIDNTSIVGGELEEAVNAICAIPAADVQPVKPCGHWLKANSRPRSWVYICSECGLPAYFPNPKHFHSCGYKFCPNCGVPMETEPK